MPALWVPAPRGAAGVGRGGRHVALGSQVPWQGLGGPRGCGHSPRLEQPWLGGRLHLASLEPAQSHGAHGGVCMAPCWGSEQSPLPPAPRPGPRPMQGRGRPGRKRLPAGLEAGYKGGPESLSGMRWRLSRFPRQPRCRKYTRSWWRLPQRWAGCHAAGGAQPRTQVCRHGTPVRGGGSTVGRRSWALAGTKGSCPGSFCPRLPLMCRDFALGKAGRFPRSSQLEPSIQHPGVPARAPASPGALSTARFPSSRRSRGL